MKALVSRVLLIPMENPDGVYCSCLQSVQALYSVCFYLFLHIYNKYKQVNKYKSKNKIVYFLYKLKFLTARQCQNRINCLDFGPLRNPIGCLHPTLDELGCIPGYGSLLQLNADVKPGTKQQWQNGLSWCHPHGETQTEFSVPSCSYSRPGHLTYR